MPERPVVAATAHELLRAATGHPIVVSVLDGSEVLLRLPTAGEFRRLVNEARTGLASHGLELPDPPTDGQIEAAVRPLEIPPHAPQGDA